MTEAELQKLFELILRLESEDVIWIKGKPYCVKPADWDDIERVGHGVVMP